MTSPKKLAQYSPDTWINVVDLHRSDETIIIGGAFTDPAEIERMQAAMRRPHARRVPPKPRRYHPSLMAHRPD